MVMGEVVVVSVSRGFGEEEEGEEGWVRSKPVCVECSQKFDFEPMRALRWGSGGMVEDMAAIWCEESVVVWLYVVDFLGYPGR